MTAAVTPQPASIGLTRSHSLLALLIALFTRGPYAHAFIATGRRTSEGGIEIIEAASKGARYWDARKYRKVLWLEVLTAGMSMAEREAAVAWAVAHLGTPYNWVDDFLIGWRCIFHFALPFSKRRIASDKTLMCSQLDVAALRAGGRDVDPGEPDGGICPNDLWRIAKRWAAAA
jgi:uncharacterized protein YycO